MKERALPFDAQIRNVELAAYVAAFRTLDFNDACAEVGKAHGCGRSCEKLGKIEKKEVGERSHLAVFQSFKISRAASEIVLLPVIASWATGVAVS